MLPLAVIQEVRRLLKGGELSQRKIAQKLGISRGTVGAIASGRRGEYGREPELDGLGLCCFARPPERCSSCGAMVYKPCVLCAARDFRSRHRLLQSLQTRRQLPSRRVA